jgi:drug/metabolite transporter (DMT)-like permease
MVAAAFCFSVMSLIVKRLGTHIPTAEIVFARSVVMLALSWVMVRRAGVSVWGVRRSLLVLRALAGFGALFCFFYAVTHLPLADVTVIHFTNPAFTAIIAAVALGEAMGRREVAGLVLSLSGVVMIARPTFLFGAAESSLDPVAVGAALASSLMSSVAYVTIRKLRETDHALVVIFYFTLISVPLSVPFMAGHLEWPTPFEWVLLSSIGVVTYIAQVFLTTGLHRERAGRAMSISYVQVVFAALWGFLVFRETPGPVGIAGAALVFAGMLIVAGKRHVLAAPEPAGR